MGRIALILILCLPDLAIAGPQGHVPFLDQPTIPTVGTTQTSRTIADASGASSGQWTLIGPQPLMHVNTHGMEPDSGWVYAMAVDPMNSSVVYLGAGGGGVWKTTDGGQTWTPLTDNQPCLSITALVLDATNPDIVYAGTAFVDSQYDRMGAGILKSTNGGATWAQLPGPLPTGLGLVAEVWSLAVSPSDGNVVLAVAESAGGVALYRSADAGNTWSQVLAPGTNAGRQVLFDPTNGNTAYASLDTVYKSTDGGNTWALANGTGINVLPTGTASWLGIAPSSPSVLYAGAEPIVSAPSSGANIYKSVDAGENWTPLSGSPLCWDVVVDPADPNVVFAAAWGLERSTDGGSTWALLDAGGGGYHGGVAFSADGSLLYLGSEWGVWVATNVTNSSWTRKSLNTSLATSLMQGVAIHPTDPVIAIAGTSNNGAAMYSGALAWQSVACDNGGPDFAFDFMNPSTTYLTCASPQEIEKSTDSGATFAPVTSGIDPSELATGIQAMAMDPGNPQRLYFASSLVWQTNDGANTWTAISPALGPGIQDEVLAVAATDPSTVYLGNSTGAYVTTSALSGSGATWTAAGEGLPYNVVQCTNFEPGCPQLNRLVADPANAATAYAVYASYVSGHVFKTTNRGGTWTDISGNLPNLKVGDIAVDPDVPNTLYIATEQAVYVTSDGGNTWNLLGTGLPNVAVTAVKLQRPTRILFAATDGRSAWSLQLAAVASPVALSAANLTFGNHAPAQTVTLTNSGRAPLTLYSVGTPNGFSQANNCGVQIAAGASCTLTVNFVASTPGSYSGNISLSDDAPGQPQLIAVSGTGTGAAPGAAFSPASLTFGSQMVSTTSAANSVTLANNGSATLAITSVAVSANFAETNTCGGSVVAGAKCTLSVTFTPTAVGPLTGTLTVTDNAPGGSQTVALSGAGQDFSVSVTSSSSATVAPGQPGYYTLGLAPAGGFNQSVSFSCSGAPSQATCSVSPASVTLNGSSSQNVGVTVATTAASAAPLTRPPAGRGEWPMRLWLFVLGLAAVAATWSAAAKLPHCRQWELAHPHSKAVALAVILLLMLSWASCGSGGSSGGGGGNLGTPAGTYNLTVTGTYTSGSIALTHSVTLTLTVE